MLLSAKSHYGARQLPLDCDITVDLENERFKTVISTDTDGLISRRVGGIHEASCLEINDRLSLIDLSLNLKYSSSDHNLYLAVLVSLLLNYIMKNCNCTL